MTPSATTAPVQPPATMSDADLYESLRNRGLSHASAILHVERRRRAANQSIEEAPSVPSTSPETAALLAATRTATSGTADEMIGALNALSGGYRGPKPAGAPFFDPAIYAQSRDQARALQNQALMEHPGVSMGAGFLGAQVNPLNYLLGPLTKFMTPAQTGMTYGATLAAAQGAGEGETPLGRATGAAGGAVAGGIAGGTLGYLGGKAQSYAKNLWKAVQPIFQRTTQNLATAAGKDVPEEVINGLTESSVRAQLAKQRFQPQDIENAVALWKNGGKPPAPALPAPIAVRPGEIVTPTEDLNKPTFMRRGGSVRQDMSPISGNRTISGQGTAAPAPIPAPLGTETQPYNQQNAARNAYNLLQSAGGSPADATAAARNAAGYMSSWDPRQALMLALLLGGGAAGKTAP